MRYYHFKRNQSFFPAVNLDKLWTLVSEQTRVNAAKNKRRVAPIVDVVQLGYYNVLGKGKLPKQLIIVKARFSSRRAEEKIKRFGGGRGPVSWWLEVTEGASLNANKFLKKKKKEEGEGRKRKEERKERGREEEWKEKEGKKKALLPVTHTCNLSHSAGRDQEDCGLKPAWANSSARPYLKKPFTKNRAGGVAQGEDPEFKPQYCKRKKKENLTNRLDQVEGRISKLEDKVGKLEHSHNNKEIKEGCWW
jgi:large subunit ribosomal protein L27Ae